MRFPCKITSLITSLAVVLFSTPLGSQTAVQPRVGTEAELATFTVSLTGLPVIVTNASNATDCTFSSGTGNDIHYCFWCDATSSWLVAGTCVAVTGNWTDSAATAWTDSAATEWTNQ